jgi:hypothetical protein
MRSMVEGFFQVQKGPSTTLRVVPLPCKCRAGINDCKARLNVDRA